MVINKYNTNNICINTINNTYVLAKQWLQVHIITTRHITIKQAITKQYILHYHIIIKTTQKIKTM